jgi:signal transduction histidine kinase
LGLAICRRAVTDLGGTIAIESQQGVGTSVIIRLPAITRSTSSSQTDTLPSSSGR